MPEKKLVDARLVAEIHLLDDGEDADADRIEAGKDETEGAVLLNPCGLANPRDDNRPEQAR